MQALQLRYDMDAPKLAERAEYYHISDLDIFEAGLWELQEEHYRDKGNIEDAIISPEDVEVVMQTGAIPVDKMQAFADVFSNIGLSWLEEAMRTNPFGGEEDEEKFCRSVSDAWYELSRALLKQYDIIQRLTDIETIVNYEVKEK